VSLKPAAAQVYDLQKKKAAKSMPLAALKQSIGGLGSTE
jgi:hypothetical protein